MKTFHMVPENTEKPEESTHLIVDTNGSQRAEYDLKMKIDNEEVGLKVKFYRTKSSFDVQGLSPHFETVFTTLGDRTIAVYFVEVVLEEIFGGIKGSLDLETLNNQFRVLADLALKASESTKNKSKTDAKVTENKKNKGNPKP